MSGVRVLVVGSGGREHALAWKLAQSPEVQRLYVAPGNAGTAAIAENVPVPATDLKGIVAFVEERKIDLTVVGSEAPLALGLADRLRAHTHLCFGPDAAGARIESSKAFAKAVMARAGVPTAAHRVFEWADRALLYLQDAQYPLVVKADGLAAGKGVTVCPDRAAAEAAVRALQATLTGGTVLVEEVLEGPEVSLLALIDGETVVPLPTAQDHKRLRNGDTGPNTGGMGAAAPVPLVGPEMVQELVETLLRPVARELSAEGLPYRGVLYAGLMLTADGPRVLEFNCRFGDPEAQVILPLLEGDLFPWLLATATGGLHRMPSAIPVTAEKAVGVTLTAPGYPEDPQTGEPIEGLDGVPDDVLVFHGGTARNESGAVVTAGGRVLTIVGCGAARAEARRRAYSTPIWFPRFHMRTDIGRARKPVLRVGVLASGEGSNLQALLDAAAERKIEISLEIVISGAAQAGALERAARAGVPAFALPYTGDRRDAAAREAYGRQLLEHLLPFDLDLLVLAGWMHVLSPKFLQSAPFSVINVHPALLDEAGGETVEVEGHTVPVLRGMHAVETALQRCLPITGVTVHRVTEHVDEGPILARQTVPIEAGDCVESLYQRIKPVEHQLLVAAVRSLGGRR